MSEQAPPTDDELDALVAELTDESFAIDFPLEGFDLDDALAPEHGALRPVAPEEAWDGFYQSVGMNDAAWESPLADEETNDEPEPEELEPNPRLDRPFSTALAGMALQGHLLHLTRTEDEAGEDERFREGFQAFLQEAVSSFLDLSIFGCLEPDAQEELLARYAQEAGVEGGAERLRRAIASEGDAS